MNQEVITTYGYTPAAELATVVYSDGTAEIANTYDRLGRLIQVQDASGLRSLGYAYIDQVESETYTAGLLAGVSIERTFDSLARRDTLSAGLPESGSVESTLYSYDHASRLLTVVSGAHSAGYGYDPASGLLSEVAFTHGSTEVLVSSRAYDALLRLTNIEHRVNAAAIDRHAYTVNPGGQRTRVELVDGSYWEYTYDGLGQLVSGVKKQPNGTPYSGQQFGYAFDDIGNRTSVTNNNQVSLYWPNLLNQYQNRTVPGVVDVVGAADPNATVTVNLEPVTARQGAYFHKQAQVDNADRDVYANFAVIGVLNDVNAQGEDAVAEQTRQIFVPQDPESFTYDADGNLTRDGRWTYTWNGENRLVRMETRADLLSDVPRRRLSFTYDSLGRRVRKIVESRSETTYTLLSTVYFIYDGWNLMAELDEDLELIRGYTWGNDLSGSLQGAGGVGGLLAVTLHPQQTTLYPAYDGNGNITGLVDSQDGTLAAVYAYDPFGNQIADQSALETVAVGNLGYGVAAQDQATGEGFIMYSEQNVHQRFSTHPPFSLNADHFIAVRRQNDHWVYDNNIAYYSFTPSQGDVLIAACDFSANTVTLLAGVHDVYRGIPRGYADGDLAIEPEMFGGTANPGEFYFSAGSQFRVPGAAATNPFRFSTKYLDQETGLLDYGHRHYSPELGRWLNRDPLGERAFRISLLEQTPLMRRRSLLRRASLFPLYPFVLNEPVDKVDPLGLTNDPGDGYIWPSPPPGIDYIPDPEVEIPPEYLPLPDVGVEFLIGAGFGAGITELSCCNSEAKYIHAKFRKYCLGIFIEASTGGVLPTYLSRGECPGGYEGWFLEGHGKLVIGAGGCVGSKCGGVSGGIGLGGGVMMCYYELIEQNEIGCCSD